MLTQRVRIGIVGAGIAVALLHLERRGVSLLQPLSVELPRPVLPPLPATRELGRLVPLALVVAMVCIMQTSAVASTFPSEKGAPDDATRAFFNAATLQPGVSSSETYRVRTKLPSRRCWPASRSRSNNSCLCPTTPITSPRWKSWSLSNWSSPGNKGGPNPMPGRRRRCRCHWRSRGARYCSFRRRQWS